MTNNAPQYSLVNTSIFQPKLPSDPAELVAIRQKNKPNNEPVGHWTGRGIHCGSNDLWDGNLAYGCNFCSAMLAGN